MLTNFQDLWIFSKNGLPLLDFCEEERINSALMGGFFSSIQTFCNEISGTDLQAFIMNSCKFYLKSALDGNVIFVGKTDPLIKEKKIQKHFNAIIKIFNETFTPKDIINWDGDSSFFKEFKSKLTLYFKMCNL